MDNKPYIGRSISTGKYHKCASINTTICNYSGQVRGARNRPASEAEIKAAHESMFCKKCFTGGKP